VVAVMSTEFSCDSKLVSVIILTAVNVPFLEIMLLLISCIIIIIITLILICIILRYIKNELSSGSDAAFLKQEVWFKWYDRFLCCVFKVKASSVFCCDQRFAKRA